MIDCDKHHYKSSSMSCPFCTEDRKTATLVRMQRRYAFARQIIDEVEVLCDVSDGTKLASEVRAVVERYRKEIDNVEKS